MKAHGLEDMTYAKAFMVKALKEGVADPDSFANKLTDKRYAEFVTSYQFREVRRAGDLLQQGAARRPEELRHPGRAGLHAATASPISAKRPATTSTISPKVTSVDDLMANNRLLTYAMAAFGLDSDTEAPRTRARDAGRRRQRSRQPRQPAERQALCEFRRGVQFRRGRRADHIERCGPEGRSQAVCRRDRPGSGQAERRLHQGRGRLLQGQHLEGEVDHRPAWPTRAC